MENASKALIMAGGVLIALMIIGALLLMFNSISNYQDTNTQTNREAQIIDFNNQFETYNRKDVRGSDLISLVNRIIDYNNRKQDEGYQKMNIEIKISDISKLAFSDENKLIKKTLYNQDNISDLVNPTKSLENKYEEKYIRELSSNINKIIDDSNAENNAKNILPKDLGVYGGIDKIKEDTATYYEYTQLKRAHFKCTGTEYNNKTGRIVKMDFEFTGKFN